MSLPAGPAAVAVPSGSRRPRRTWDLVLTIVLLVLAVLLALLLLVISPFLVFASDSCGSAGECNLDQMSAGFIVASVTPAIVTVLGIAVAVVLLVLRRRAFWVPIVAMLLALGLFAVGVALVIGSVPGASV